MDSSMWTAFGLGIAFCAPPGAVTVEALRRGLVRGFNGALLTELGSLVGDATWAVFALSGVASLASSRPLSVLLGGLGVLMLLRLAALALRDAWLGTVPRGKDVAFRGDFAAGAFLSLSNPFAVAFWLGLGGSVVALAPGRHGPAGMALFLGAFMLAALLWSFFFAAAIAWGKGLLRPSFYRGVNLVCGLALAYFALRLAAPVARAAGLFAGL